MTTTLTPPETSAPPLDANSASVNIALSKIVPSKTNPGRSFDPKRDSDTVDSIRIHGVLQPILVRPLSESKVTLYEIVAGERRFHCSHKAGRTSIPAVIRKLSDVEALELQTIENDQREDLDPLAKAAAFRRLWDAYTKSGEGKAEQRMERMVERLGRKPRTVWNLLSLGNLSTAGQKMLREGEISQSHAYEICTRPPAEQKKILEWIEDEARYSAAPSVRELKEYIREECDHFLDAAPFPKDDATLLPGAGACTKCPKNSAVNPNLVDLDAKGKAAKRAICTDSDCYKQKVHNNLVRIETAARKAGDETLRVSTLHNAPKGAKPAHEWKQVTAKSCQYAVLGILVDGDKTGQTIHVCIMTNVCKTHFQSHSRAGVPRSDAEKKAMLQKQRNNKLDQAKRTAVTAAIRKQVKALKPADWNVIALAMFDSMDRRFRNPVLAAMGWKPSTSSYGPSTPIKQITALKPADLASFMALMAIADNVLPNLPDYIGRDSKVDLQPFAKRHGINLAKIHATAAAPLQAHWKQIDAKKRKAAKAAALQTSAKKKQKAVA